MNDKSPHLLVANAYAEVWSFDPRSQEVLANCILAVFSKFHLEGTKTGDVVEMALTVDGHVVEYYARTKRVL